MRSEGRGGARTEGNRRKGKGWGQAKLEEDRGSKPREKKSGRGDRRRQERRGGEEGRGDARRGDVTREDAITHTHAHVHSHTHTHAPMHTHTHTHIAHAQKEGQSRCRHGEHDSAHMTACWCIRRQGTRTHRAPLPRTCPPARSR
jgi:hypothetical protein